MSSVPKSTSIRGKLFLLVGITLALMALLGLEGIVTQNAQNARLNRSLAETSLAISSIDASDEATIHFKKQVQEWKDLLLRGQTKEDYDYYLAAFESEYVAVEVALEQSRTTFEKLDLDTAPVRKAQAEHAALHTRYLEALKLYDTKNPTSYLLADKSIRGMDRPPTEDIDKLHVIVINALQKRYDDTRSAAAASLQFAFIVSALMLILAIAASFILNAVLSDSEKNTRALRESEANLRIYAEVIRSTGELVIITDPDGKVIECNPAYQRATGRSRDDMVGMKLHMPGRDPHPEEFYRELWSELKAQGYWTGEIMDRRNDGESFPCWALFNAVRDEQGKPIHYVCVLRDITTLKQNAQQLEKLAFNDSLTGFPNRALFKDRLTVALAGAERQANMLGVIYLDLDRFKYINDTLGHAAGDRLLVEISRRIGTCLRPSDTLARMGGDEFTILLPHIDTQADAVRVAEKIIEVVGNVVHLDDESVYVGASIGISYFPKDGRDAESMQKNADMAMYEAKEAGRGQYRVFSPELVAKWNQRVLLSTQIDAAWRNDEFTLVYQPMVNLTTGRPESVEASIRWQQPGGGWVAPATLIPHAEQTGLIKKIDSWVLERACSEATTWSQERGQDLAVCVNLSAASMQQPGMAKMIKNILRKTGLPASRLNLAITESAVKDDPNAAQAMLEEVASLGVSFSVNDFGTAYSSLSYLSQFPINCLKLDHLFIDRIGKDKASEEVVQMVLQLAHKLHLRVVAEGVDQPGQQVFLAKAGCEIMQGSHFVRPMPSEQLEKWLSTDHGFANMVPNAGLT
jgi:diguanylate cyclase (GGDEF)-like protein/PAS domain S-box-containing protein